MPPYAFSLPDRRKEQTLAVRPTQIVRPASQPDSNDDEESALGQLQLPILGSQTE